MLNTTRITSKRQITIPATIYRELNLKIGQNLIVERKKETILLVPAEKLVERLAGSVRVSEKLRGMNKEWIVRDAKKKHFAKKYAKAIR